MLFLNHK